MFRRSVALALVASASAFTTGAFAPALRPAQRAVSQQCGGLQMSCPLTPMGANIIVTMDQEGGKEQKSDSGILIAASVKTDGPKTGEVKAVGTGWTTESGVKVPLDEVKVGDKIMFREPSSFENRKMKVSDVDYYVISVNDVLAKVN